MAFFVACVLQTMAVGHDMDLDMHLRSRLLCVCYWHNLLNVVVVDVVDVVDVVEDGLCVA